MHLQEIALAVEPGAHAVLFVDQAGWHVTAKLEVPENMTLVPFPSKSPELNPVENIWQYMRDNWLSNRIFCQLRRHRRSLLLQLEQTGRTPLAHHVDWNPRLGPWVRLLRTWYYPRRGLGDEQNGDAGGRV